MICLNTTKILTSIKFTSHLINSIACQRCLIRKLKNVINKKKREENGKRVFISKIRISADENGTYKVLHPGNKITLIVVGLTGKIEIWDVGVASQGGRLFLVQHQTWNTQCYQQQNKMVCPLFTKDKPWPQMTNFLTSCIKDIQSLPRIETSIQEDINLKIFRAFEERDISFAFPTQTLHIQKQE